MRPALRLPAPARLLRAPRSLLRAPLLSTHPRAVRHSISTPPRRLFTHIAPRQEKSTAPDHTTFEVAELSDHEYHELSDYYLNRICAKYEEIQDESDNVDVEFSAGVLTITFPQIGTYVINKQPPNKQIWLSSPLSGPKRYDYVFVKDTQNSTEVGNWLYSRDQSSLRNLLLEETGADIELLNDDADQ
ncbi:uncharacterized protein DNG_06019 [Cephalotrichum gorgonifer]|uniref:ferroxidase n=1 Tax=Cephalotrichum gorgonifer TaxID=2041049 RepID=A0AAE8MZ93_9PEZI|nr:uncharacterized protein DNG_06019 [Cephalotrichum gorgonifer]